MAADRRFRGRHLIRQVIETLLEEVLHRVACGLGAVTAARTRTEAR